MNPAPQVLAFDVNETLLDLRALDAPFEEALGDAALRQVWFQTMLQLAFVGEITGQYVDFTTAQRAALAMVAQRAGRTIAAERAEALVARMRDLPPHPDVPGALRRLQEAGFRQVALTNSPLEVARDQLANAGIAGLFEETISADEIQELKPAPGPYRLVARRTGVEIADVRLVAAHGWDVSGALAAGARAAFVARPGAMLSPIGPQPDIAGPDLAAIAEALIAAR